MVFQRNKNKKNKVVYFTCLGLLRVKWKLSLKREFYKSVNIKMDQAGGYNFKCVEENSKHLQCVSCTYLLKKAYKLPCGHLSCWTCTRRFVFLRRSPGTLIRVPLASFSIISSSRHFKLRGGRVKTAILQFF